MSPIRRCAAVGGSLLDERERLGAGIARLLAVQDGTDRHLSVPAAPVPAGAIPVEIPLPVPEAVSEPVPDLRVYPAHRIRTGTDQEQDEEFDPQTHVASSDSGKSGSRNS